MCDIIYIYDATGLLYGFRYSDVDYYYNRDVLGNINHIILANWQVVATYKYEGYGKRKVLNASVNVYFNSDDEGHDLFSFIMNNIYIVTRNI